MTGVSGSSTDSPTAFSRSAASATRPRSPGNQATCIAYISIRVARGGSRLAIWAAPSTKRWAALGRPWATSARARTLASLAWTMGSVVWAAARSARLRAWSKSPISALASAAAVSRPGWASGFVPSCTARSYAAAAAAGLPRGALQLRRDLFIRPGRRRCQVPGPPVGVRLAAQRAGQRSMRGQPLAQRYALVQCRTDQRMTERHSAAGDADQPGPLGRCQGGSLYPERPAGIEHHAEVAAVL